MIAKNYSTLVLTILVLLSGLLHFVQISAQVQDEHDDLYFSSKDRKNKLVVTDVLSDVNVSYESYSNNTYNNSTFSSKRVNPEYIEKYKQQARQTRASEEQIENESKQNPT